MTTQYTSETGDKIVVDPATVAYINALATLTGRSFDDLLAEATELLRVHLVPSTKRAAAPKKRGRQAQPQAGNS